MRRFFCCVATLVMAFGALVAQETKQSDLSRLLSPAEKRPAVTKRTLERILLAADQQYNTMQQGGPASLALLLTLLDLADYHQKLWLQVPEERRAAAQPLAERVFFGYKTAWHGLSKAAGKKALRRLTRDAQIYLVLRLTAHQAHMGFRGLGTSWRVGEKAQYWSAYERLAAYADQFGFLSLRDRAAIARLIQGSAVENRARRGLKGKEEDMSAANAMLQTARWTLERALKNWREGNPRKGKELLRQGTDSLGNSLIFGIERYRVRETLGHFAVELGGDEPLGGLTGNPSLRAALYSHINRSMERATGLLAKDLRIPSVVVATSSPEMNLRGEITVRATVTEKKRKLNRDVLALETLEAFILQASGQPSLEAHMHVSGTAALVFHGELLQIVGEKKYDDLRRRYLQRVPRKQQQAAKDSYPLLGRSILSSPAVSMELLVQKKDQAVLQLAVDRPELWLDIADLWREEAQVRGVPEQPGDPASELRSRIYVAESWRQAQQSYIRCSLRMREEKVPSLIHLAIGDSGQKVLGARATLIAYLSDQGVIREQRLDSSSLEERMNGRQPTRIAQRIVPDDFALRMQSVVLEAYDKVIKRGPKPKRNAPPELQDRHYAQYATALAKSSVFTGDDKYARRLTHRRSPAYHPPTNGFQYYARAIVRRDILRDPAAIEDFRRAEDLLSELDDERAIGPLEDIRDYLRNL